MKTVLIMSSYKYLHIRVKREEFLSCHVRISVSRSRDFIIISRKAIETFKYYYIVNREYRYLERVDAC